MIKTDYYTTLELNKTCTPQDVKQSYRRLALRWHPDKCLNKSEAQLKFNEIHEAYTILSDASRKKIYDDYGHQGLMNDGSSQPGENRFFKKGFQGAEKSAFDVLNDILKEKDDDGFLQGYEGLRISDQFKSSIKSFIDDDLFQNEQDAGSESFFETYKPTFMNPNFFAESSTLFGADFDKCTTSSFSFQPMDMRERTYSGTSTTVIQSEKTDSQTTGLNEKPKLQRASYIFINESAQDDPIYTYARDAEFYAAFELNKEMAKGTEAKSNINASSKKISKEKESLNIRLVNKKPSKKNRN